MMLASRTFPFSRNPTPVKSKDAFPTCESKSPLSATSNWQRMETPSAATSEPVVIPARTRNSRQIPRSEPRSERRNDARRNSEKLSASTRALLADTSIPPPKFNKGRRRSSGQRLTVDAVLQHQRVTEKELSKALGRSSSYMDILLSPPDELGEDETIQSDAGRESILSLRTMSSDSVPSLDGASPGDASSSFRSSVATPSSRVRRSTPTRSWLSLASIASGESASDHPLSSPEIDEDFTFKSSDNTSIAETCSDTSEILQLPQRGFKSNITASLRAIKMAARSSARSIASFTAPPIMPDDFLHRSIITEPKMPFTDDRMPPVLLDVPTPELRRYLNPISNAPIEAHVPSSKITINGQTTIITASMQLRTYRLNRASPSQNHSVISIRTKPTPPEPENLYPMVQERGYRDNSDIERRMCFDKLMRQAGKLGENAPSKAYFSYPPRTLSRLPYKIGADGVPERWIGITPVN